NTFLTDDLLGRSNPFASGKTSESFIDAITQASPGIDRMFRNEPLIAARLHQAIARALDARTDYGDARVEYERSAALFRQAQGPVSQDAMVVEFQRATLEARSYEKDTLPLARSIVQQQDALMATLRQPRPDLAVWDASARGMVALITNDAPGATADFRKAVDLAGALPEFDPTARLTFQQRLAFCYVRLGDGRQAEKLFRHLIAAFTAAAGPDSANVLRVRLNLAQAYMIEKKYAEAIHETSAIYPLFVARLGPDHELTLQLLATRAESEGSLGLWNDAVRDDLTVYRLAVQKQGLSSFFAIATLSDAALAQCRGGDFLQGSVNAQRAYDVSARAFGAQAGLTGGAAYTVASCLIGLGRLQKASLFLKQIDVPVVVQLTGDPDFGADVTLANAQIASREGDQRTARSAMDQVRAVFTRADAEPFQKRAFDTLRAALDAPQTPPAGQRLPAATPR
ncbi:MAG: tetratricopeptide repeat protein, partial [Acidobacteriaceae bacterium]